MGLCPTFGHRCNEILSNNFPFFILICPSDNIIIQKGALDWSSRYCQGHTQCNKVTGEALQHLILNPGEFKDFGTFLQHFAEPFIGVTFHPQLIYGEHRFLYDQADPLQQEVYKYLTSIGDQFLLEDGLGVAIHDIPMLFLPLSSSEGAKVKLSKREKEARYVFASHGNQWMKLFLPQGYSTYSFKAIPLTVFSIMGDYANVGNLEELIEADIQNMISHLDSIEREGHKVYDITTEFGRNDVNQMFANNHYGKILRPHLGKIMSIMRFSMTLGNPGVDNDTLSALAGDLSILDYPLKSIGIDASDTTRLDSILDCWLTNATNDCKLFFKHAVTNAGICNVFNGGATSRQYKTNSYLEMFKESFDLSTTPTINGAKGIMTLTLDTHQLETFGSESGHFTIAFNSELDSFDVLTENIVLEPGQKSVIYVEVTKFETTKAVRNDFSMEERSCR